jgi:predicted transposase YdaD
MLGITLQHTRVYQEIESETTVKLIIRQLTKRFGELSEEIRQQISGLPMPVLENLADALLDFNSLADLQTWLQAQ